LEHFKRQNILSFESLLSSSIGMAAMVKPLGVRFEGFVSAFIQAQGEVQLERGVAIGIVE
jgi:hypothetical protein